MFMSFFYWFPCRVPNHISGVSGPLLEILSHWVRQFSAVLDTESSSQPTVSVLWGLQSCPDNAHWQRQYQRSNWGHTPNPKCPFPSPSIFIFIKFYRSIDSHTTYWKLKTKKASKSGNLEKHWRRKVDKLAVRTRNSGGIFISLKDTENTLIRLKVGGIFSDQT